MGLKTDIYNAFENMLSNQGAVELSSQQKDNIDTLSIDVTEAIKTFLAKQTWEITEMKAFVELDQIWTETPRTADIITAQGQTASWPAGVVGALQPVIIGNQKNVINIPKLRIEKTSDGMRAIGHAFLGNPSTDGPSLYSEFDTRGDGEGWNQYAKVKINKTDMVEDE